jgi:hypothetical protein
MVKKIIELINKEYPGRISNNTTTNKQERITKTYNSVSTD